MCIWKQVSEAEMHSFVPRAKMNGKLGFMFDFHYNSLIFKEL